MALFSRPLQSRRAIGVFRSYCFALLTAVASLGITAHWTLGAITWTGDVDPSDPNTWTDETYAYIGRTVDGTLMVDGDSDLRSYTGLVGYDRASTGAVVVAGAGSTWTNGRTLSVGNFGKGTLAISDGGVVEVAGNTVVAYGPESSGEIHFDGGALSTGGLLAAAANLTGTGTIDLHGLVSDVDIAFDASHGLRQSIILNELPGQNITLNLGVDGSGAMGAGYGGVGTMTVSDGIVVRSTSGHIGNAAGSSGTVTVDGIGSTWTNADDLYIGDTGSGSLGITGGGTVSTSKNSFIGRNNGSTGAVMVDGAGSTWNTASLLYIGLMDSNGTLSITNGGRVNSTNSYIRNVTGATETVRVNGPGSTWTNSGELLVGNYGRATLVISDGGVVSVAGTLTVDANSDGNAFINMASDGMLALMGDADDSLGEYLDLVQGTDAIRYWDNSLSAWALLTSAAYGDDYTLEYLTAGDLAGYTLLTVLAPGPPGDFDVDGIVDGGDFLAWQRGASPDPHSPADLAAWQAHYGDDLSAATAAAIPEPAAWVLAALGAMLLVRRRAGRHC